MVDDSVREYFGLQERFNSLNRELLEVKKCKEGLLDKVRIDVESVFLAFDDFCGTYRVVLTDSGLRIVLDLKRYNDYGLVDMVPVGLIVGLDNLMGVGGVLNVIGERMVGGNLVCSLELVYEVV